MTASGPRSGGVLPAGDVTPFFDGSSTVLELGDVRMVVVRRPDGHATPLDHEHTLTGVWSGVDAPVVLAYVA